MGLRKGLYTGLSRLRGRQFPSYYVRYLREDEARVSARALPELLEELLAQCQRSVPYYAKLMAELGGSYAEDPEAYLARLPILTKRTIRQHSSELRSRDLAERRWYYNTSGRSTGEPVRLIQDSTYLDQATAVKMLFSQWAGKEIDDTELRVWGSERDIIGGGTGWAGTLRNWLTNTVYFNAFRMTPETMRCLAERLNRRPPRLIVGYVRSMCELARFFVREGIAIQNQTAIITTAGTLHEFMRDEIEAVFGCRVHNRYGSREVGDIACQCSAVEGLHVAPWANYVEIVDDGGRRVPDGVEGEILITSLINYSMPLVRYQIGDRGALSTSPCSCGRPGQVLSHVTGRSVDAFRRKDGTVIEPGYFVGLLYFREWLSRYQVIQEDYTHVVYRIVRSALPCERKELDDITAKTKSLMGAECDVSFDFVDDIATTPSGKYRYVVSRVHGQKPDDNALDPQAG